MPESSPERPDLTQRFRMQVFFPEIEKGKDDADSWDTINSFATPSEALRGCSECLETVKLLMEVPYSQDLEIEFIRIRVWDAENDKLVIWEDEAGVIHSDETFIKDARP